MFEKFQAVVDLEIDYSLSSKFPEGNVMKLGVSSNKNALSERENSTWFSPWFYGVGTVSRLSCPKSDMLDPVGPNCSHSLLRGLELQCSMYLDDSIEIKWNIDLPLYMRITVSWDFSTQVPPQGDCMDYRYVEDYDFLSESKCEDIPGV